MFVISRRARTAFAISTTNEHELYASRECTYVYMRRRAVNVKREVQHFLEDSRGLDAGIHFDRMSAGLHVHARDTPRGY
jgi:hypothetical protein